MSTHALNKQHQSTSLSVTGQLNCYPHTNSHIHSCAFKKKNNEKKGGGGGWQRKQSTHHRIQTPHSKLRFLYPFMLFLYLLPSPSPISFFFLSLLIQQALPLFLCSWDHSFNTSVTWRHQRFSRHTYTTTNLQGCELTDSYLINCPSTESGSCVKVFSVT